MKRRILIRQRDHSDCGPACIASVAACYRKALPVSRLRQIARTDTGGTSMLGMVETLEKLGFEARGLRGEYKQLAGLPHPFIAHLVLENDLHHYVCVYHTGKKKLRIMDPASGSQHRWTSEQFKSRWSGALIALVPGTSNEEYLVCVKKSQRIRSLLAPVRGPLLQAFISAVFYTLLGLSTSVYLGKLTDHVFVNGNRGLLNLMSLVMLVLILCMLSLALIRNLLMLKSGQVIDNQLILSYYRHLLRLPQRFFDSMKTGEILSRINDAVKIRSFINDAAVGLVVNALILIFSYLFLFLIDVRMALIMCVMLPLYALVYVIYNQRNRRMERLVMEDAAFLEDHLVESIGSAGHLRLFNLESQAGQNSEHRLNHLLDKIYSSGLNSIGAGSASEALNRLFTIILLWTGSTLVIGNMLSAGQLLTCYALMGYLTGPVGRLLGANRTYQNARIAADRLFEIFDLEPEQSTELPSFPRNSFGCMEFRDLGFAYGSRGMLFQGVNLEILPGCITIIKGESGSGKSTLAALAAHLYPPDRGQILLNGCDTRYYSRESLRALCGVVPQDLKFLSGSILENLAPGEKEPELFRLSRLLEKTGLSAMINALPEGLNTEVKLQGANFSGGERQRLALVRALYRDPMLLILDEPSSALDEDSERLVNRLILEEREKGRSILMITHKKSYMGMADRVYHIKKGQVLALPPVYADPV